MYYTVEELVEFERRINSEYSDEVDELVVRLLDESESLPNNPIGYRFRAVLRTHMEQYDLALADCDQAISIDPNFAAVHMQKGMINKLKDDLPEASLSFTEVCNLCPTLALAHWHLADCMNKLGDYDGAIEECTIALTLKPDFTMALIQRAFAKTMLNDETAALNDYNRIVEIQPSVGMAYKLRADLLMSMSDYMNAAKDYSTCIELEPDYIDTYSLRGDARAKLGDMTGALEDWTMER